ncbi:MAG TPA: hypothetical protein DCR93_19560 [Cytophagales bacterium]|nr:hypothetical protein [Cytophagales bacterium]HAP61597.1 hypothetical protein [Cytophagales bacterium]
MMPIIVLALGVLSLVFWFSLDPLHAHRSWLITLLHGHPKEGPGWLLWVSMALSVLGVAAVLFRKRPGRAKVETSPGILARLSYQALFLDLFYQKTVVPFSVQVGKATNWLDSRAWDGLVHLLSKGQVVGAQLVQFADRYLVDGLVNGVAKLAKRVGHWLSTPRSGQIQTYLIRALAVTVLVLAILILW